MKGKNALAKAKSRIGVSSIYGIVYRNEELVIDMETILFENIALILKCYDVSHYLRLLYLFSLMA